MFGHSACLSHMFMEVTLPSHHVIPRRRRNHLAATLRWGSVWESIGGLEGWCVSHHRKPVRILSDQRDPHDNPMGQHRMVDHPSPAAEARP